MLTGHKITKTLKALGPVHMALAFFAAVAGAEVPNHLTLMASDLYKALIESKINARVHVIGFDVGAQASAELACIPKMGNGQYFSASSAQELKLAFAAVKKVTEEARVIEVPIKPNPVKPKAAEHKEVWRDDFEGDSLADEWEVINPDPDSFIVENGVLSVIAASHEPLQGGSKLPNIFRLNKPLPKGDWTITMRLIPEVSTFRERYILGIYSNKDKMLTATVGNPKGGQLIYINLWGDKVNKGENTGFTTTTLKSGALGNLTQNLKNFTGWTKKNLQAILLRIKKTGRAYITSTRIEGELTMSGGKKPEWVNVQKLTSMRSPGDSLVIAFRQIPYTHSLNEVEGGESLMHVDWVKIEAPEKNE